MNLMKIKFKKKAFFLKTCNVLSASVCLSNAILLIQDKYSVCTVNEMNSRVDLTQYPHSLDLNLPDPLKGHRCDPSI